MAEAVTGQAQAGGTDRTPPEGWRLYGAFASLLLAVALLRLYWAGASNRWTGADPWYYTALADSLAAGRGFVVDYVRFHLRPYPTVAGRPEDWIAPLYPLSMVPFIWLWGKTYLAYCAPAILCGTIGLPLATRALALRLGMRWEVALGSAVIILLHPALFVTSQRPMTDLPFTLLVVLALYWFLRTDDGPWAALLAGAFIGLAVLTRAVALWLMPLLPLLHALRKRSWRALFSREMLLLESGAVVLQLPWWVRNRLVFGSPMYSVYQYMGACVGRPDMSVSQAYGFWWNRPLPTMADRYGLPLPVVAGMLGRYLLWGCDMLFVGSIYSAGSAPVVVPSQFLYQSLWGLPALAMLAVRRREWASWFAVALIFSLLVAIAVLNMPGQPRYFFPVYPLIVIYGWRAWHGLARRLGGGRAVAILLTLFILPAAAFDAYRGPKEQTSLNAGVEVGRLAMRDVAAEVRRRTAPGTILLTDANPAMMVSLSARPTVMSPPGAAAEEVAQVVEHYHANCAVAARGEPLEDMLRALGWRTWWVAEPLVVMLAPGSGP